MNILEAIRHRRSVRTFDGIALCHFELAAGESGLETSFEIADPALPGQEDLQYIGTFTVEEQ